MNRLEAVYQFRDELKQHLPALSRPQAFEVALWSMAVFLKNGATLQEVMVEVRSWLGVSVNTARQRLRDLYLPADKKRGKKRATLEPRHCFADLLRWVLSLLPQKSLTLALDASNKKDKMIVLCLSVVAGGCAVPVAWHLVPADQKGKWRYQWLDLLERIRPAVPDDWQVLVLADRGLWGPWLFYRVCEIGWHCLLRVNDRCNPLFTSGSGTCWRPLSCLPPLPGQEDCRRVSLFKGQPLSCFLIRFFGETAKEPWYLVTDWQEIGAQSYAQRFWIECSFKCIKSAGFHWESSHIRRPDRMARLWLVYAVCLLLSLTTGSQEEALQAGTAPVLYRLSGCRVRRVSLFSLGMSAVRSRIAAGARLFCPNFSCHIWEGMSYAGNTS